MKEYVVVVCLDYDIAEFIEADKYEISPCGVVNYLYFMKDGEYIATFSQWQFVREWTKEDQKEVE